MNVGWKALTDDQRNEWLSQSDSKGIVEKSNLGFLVGYYDIDGDGVKDDNEAIYFFKEVASGGNVYVITLTPEPGGNGAFRVEVKQKNKDGSLSELPRSAFESARWGGLKSDYWVLKSTNWTLTAESLKALNKTFTDWADRPPKVETTPFVSFSTWGDKYLGWGRSPGGDWSSKDYDVEEQGDPSKNKAGVAGWGGWVSGVFDDGDGDYVKWHQLTAYEAYEVALSGKSYGEYNALLGWAEKNGITIGLVTIRIDGVDTQTMGFSKTIDGCTYTFYWDPVNQCNRIGKVLDEQGNDITSAVLARQTTTNFGKSWSEISERLVLAKGNGATLGKYLSDFNPENTSGSAEAPTKAEREAYENFKQSKWKDYFDSNGRLTRLPTSAEDRKELLDALMKLNPAHILELFTGSPGNGNVDGLDLLMTLIGSVSLTDAHATKLSETLGKLMYLVGRSLARKVGKNDNKDQVDYWKKLQSKLSVCVTSLSKILRDQGFGLTSMEKVLFSFMLGLRNYTKDDGDVNAVMLTPEETLLYLIGKLAEAGNMGGADYSRENAQAMASFVVDVTEMLGMLKGLQSLKFGSGLNDSNASSVAIISVATQESRQKLLALAFGALASYAANSTAAQDVFVNQQKSSQEDSRKLQDAMASLYTKYWEAMAELTKQMGRN